MSDNNPVWWEKTVEYQFVINNHREFQFVAPLDGNHEKQTSDTILGQDNKFILIEFKRDGNSQTAEFNKFKKVANEKSNTEILKEIKSIKNHQCHFLVYAQLDEEKNRLELFHEEYLSYLGKNGNSLTDDEMINNGNSLTYDEMINKGISLKEFHEYLEKIGQLRVENTDNDTNTSTSSGGKTPEKITAEFSNVLILDNEGSCYTFNDFQNLSLQLQQQLNQELQSEIQPQKKLVESENPSNKYSSNKKIKMYTLKF
ncbi:hypothetical protein HMPREF3136_02915 [Neisseria sp. HMSC15C08]|nr:hypothetical protein HMPREF3136_02915 [Neisseria sp. HMSC15C08]